MWNRCRGAALQASLAASTIMLTAPVAVAQPVQRTYVYSQSSQSIQRLQQLASRLEVEAAQARDQARIDVRDGGSDELAERMDDFAKHARDLRVESQRGRVDRTKIRETVQRLVTDAQHVQQQAAHTNRHYARTDAAWNRALEVLNSVNTEYVGAIGLQPRGTTGTFPRAGELAPAAPFPSLASDLAWRADQTLQIASDASLDSLPDLQRLCDEVTAFRRAAPQLGTVDLRAHVAHMLADARSLRGQLVERDIPADVRDHLDGMIGDLVQMRDYASGDTTGTSGWGWDTPGPTDTGVLADDGRTDLSSETDPQQLALMIDTRATRAAQLATQWRLDDVAADLGAFSERVRTIAGRIGTLDRQDRQARTDELLRSAQRIQQDLVRRNVPANLLAEWNRVLEGLNRMVELR